MNFMFEWQEQYLTRERSEWVRLFLPREHKIHIFEPMCNVLFIIWRNQFSKSKRRESWRHWVKHSPPHNNIIYTYPCVRFQIFFKWVLALSSPGNHLSETKRKRWLPLNRKCRQGICPISALDVILDIQAKLNRVLLNIVTRQRGSEAAR